MRKRIVMLVGTRPEAIKMAPVYQALTQRRDLQVRLISTGQHGALLTDALATFGVRPDRELSLEGGVSLGARVGEMLRSLDAVLEEEKPDMVLVHGDTASAFAGALACFYRGIDCAHVEAGLRSYRLDAPFPEEFHRQVVTRSACLHFAPTQEAAENLLKEGVDSNRIVVTGSTSVDAVVRILAGAPKPSGEKLVVVTAHRRENGGQGMKSILRAVARLVRRYPDHRFLFPVHPNPEVKRAVARYLPQAPNLQVTEALAYDRFLPYLAQASLVLTDSGGIQEEAAYLGRRVLLLRDVTERPEALSCGSSRLVGTDADAIVAAAEAVLNGKVAAPGSNPFGPPGASQKIAAAVAA